MRKSFIFISFLYSTENGYDENFDVTDIHITGSRKHYFTHELKYDNGVEKTLTLPAMKFLSVRTWDKVRDYIRFHDDLGHLWDERMRRCDTERVGRVVNHFQNDDNAYFMVINAPNTEVHLITGEIGICSLLTGQRGHWLAGFRYSCCPAWVFVQQVLLGIHYVLYRSTYSPQYHN